MSPGRPPVRIAVLGTGAIAQIVHLPILSRMRGVEVVSVVDTDLNRARTIAGRFGIPVATRDQDEVWRDESIDAVVVCTPSNLHEQHTLEALEAGKYVLCEKPLALTPEGVERILARSGADTRLLVAMNQRFRPDAVALRSFVAGADLGEVFHLRAGWLNRAMGRSRRSWRDRRAAGGGALMDLGIQMLDLALWLLDYPKVERVTAHTHRVPGAEVEDSAALMLRLHPDRMVGVEVSTNLFAERDQQFLHLLGTEGSGSLSPLTVFKDMERGVVEVTPPLPPGRENLFTASYRQELQYFVEVVRGEREAEPPTEHVALMRVMSAAYRSAEERREIAF
ncbi:MAG TPA: Gfo/Idh/MocA family oxidoreductase [Longimicrobiaceae bacterium]|nr:Gfo/Idh/MocA family oxidoreductase [Longimicrobiaceae bacterium]